MWDGAMATIGTLCLLCFALLFLFFSKRCFLASDQEDRTLVTCDKYVAFFSHSRHPHERDSVVIRDRDKLTTTEARVLARRVELDR